MADDQAQQGVQAALQQLAATLQAMNQNMLVMQTQLQGQGAAQAHLQAQVQALALTQAQAREPQARKDEELQQQQTELARRLQLGDVQMLLEAVMAQPWKCTFTSEEAKKVRESAEQRVKVQEELDQDLKQALNHKDNAALKKENKIHLTAMKWMARSLNQQIKLGLKLDQLEEGQVLTQEVLQELMAAFVDSVCMDAINRDTVTRLYLNTLRVARGAEPLPKRSAGPQESVVDEQTRKAIAEVKHKELVTGAMAYGKPQASGTVTWKTRGRGRGQRRGGRGGAPGAGSGAGASSASASKSN